MTWEVKEKHTVTIRLQDRLQITYEQLDFFTSEFQEGLDSTDCITESANFAESLMSTIGSHMSKRNLEDLINECQKTLEDW